VDHVIRFVASHAAAPTTEKANSDDRVTVGKGISNSTNDIQGSEEDRNHEQQSATTNNSIF
jgi:hypothetical protein